MLTVYSNYEHSHGCLIVLEYLREKVVFTMLLVLHPNECCLMSTESYQSCFKAALIDSFGHLWAGNSC